MTRKSFCLILIFFLAISLVGCEADSKLSSYQNNFSVNVNNLQLHTEYITNVIGIRPSGSEKEKEAADYIYAYLKEVGFSETEGTLIRTSFTFSDNLTSENIVAICNLGKSDDIIDIVTHHDTVPTTPGARDNAASVAALLEISKFLTPVCESIDKEVRMVFVGAEEVGFFGSAFYVNSLSEEEKSRHIAAFIMDISVASKGEDAFLLCNTLGGRVDGKYENGNWLFPSDNLVSRSISAAFTELSEIKMLNFENRLLPPQFKAGSDHISFHKAEIEAGHICWRRMDDEFQLLPDEYHKMEDTTENLDYSTILITTICILRAVELISSGQIS